MDVFAKPGPALARARVAIGKIYVFHTLASSLQSGHYKKSDTLGLKVTTGLKVTNGLKENTQCLCKLSHQKLTKRMMNICDLNY